MTAKNLKSDYLSGDPALRPFYRHPFPVTDTAGLLAERAQFPVDRSLLVRELTEQNRGFSHAGPALENIQLLADDKTFTITTGHQLVMMGGPMYLLYKTASAIQLAQWVESQNPGVKVVPVFWMASEDHDWEEINHYHPDFFSPVTYHGEFKGPVGRHLLGPEIEADLADAPAAWKALFQPGQDLSNAFRRLMLKLFGKYGLVVIDADSPALKRALQPYMVNEIEGSGMFAGVKSASDALESNGYKVQVLPREVNLFYMGDGDRRLLLQEGDRFQLKDSKRSFSKAELLRLIETQPQDFSPNVCMRPLYQEILLPNLAYVGGWGETSYWMQLKAAFDQANVFFPVLIPRMSATLVPEANAQAWEALGFDLADLENPLHEVKNSYLARNWNDTALRQSLAVVDEAMAQLEATVRGIDIPLGEMTAAEGTKGKKFQARLLQKIRKSQRQRDPRPYQEIEYLKNLLSPDGKRQERILNFTAFDQLPTEALVQLILDHCQAETYSEQWIKLP